MSHEDALREIVKIVTDPRPSPTRKIDRIYRVLVQAGVLAVEA